MQTTCRENGINFLRGTGCVRCVHAEPPCILLNRAQIEREGFENEKRIIRYNAILNNK